MEASSIPVLTVVKRGSILKNIFLNAPTTKDGVRFIVGRHPDCEILHEHPSISRFHLEVHLLGRSVSVTDLSSVHGTYVSGKKIEPLVPVELVDGDMLKLGASTRVYILQFMPLLCTSESENPLESLIEEKEEEEESENPLHQNEIFSPERIVPSALPMPDSLVSASLNEISSSNLIEESQFSELKEPEEIINFLSFNQPLEAFVATPLLESFSNEDSSPITTKTKNTNSGLLSRRKNLTSLLQVQTGQSKESKLEIESDRGESICKNLFSDGDEEEMFDSDKENMICLRHKLASPNAPADSSPFLLKRSVEKPLTRALFPEKTESSYYDFDDDDDDVEEFIYSYKENLTPGVHKSLKSKNMERSSRKSVTEDNELTETIDRECFSVNKENQTPIRSGKTKGKEPLSDSRQEFETEISKKRVERVPLQSLYENPFNSQYSPVSDPKKHGSKSSRRRRTERVPFGSLAEKQTESQGSTSAISHKTNSKNRENNVERPPFQSLQLNENTKPKITEPPVSNGKKKKWNMVADMSCFMNQESMRSLQLLQGIRGTHLIIPRMVIRELDCLKRQESVFRKPPRATLVLQWIEECMRKTDGWIHVQNSEEVLPIAPTPTAICEGKLKEKLDGICGESRNKPFSAYGSMKEIVSPTAEDHILDCVLIFKQIKCGEQLVLLSDSVSLKIKAMAEGVLCETAVEFRESLVNPWSERFLWAESSPRGPTWSLSDEVELIGKGNHYNHFPAVRRSANAAENAKGLKLILLHNCHYGLI